LTPGLDILFQTPKRTTPKPLPIPPKTETTQGPFVPLSERDLGMQPGFQQLAFTRAGSGNFHRERKSQQWGSSTREGNTWDRPCFFHPRFGPGRWGLVGSGTLLCTTWVQLLSVLCLWPQPLTSAADKSHTASVASRKTELNINTSQQRFTFLSVSESSGTGDYGGYAASHTDGQRCLE
jgi:hypothetical protein